MSCRKEGRPFPTAQSQHTSCKVESCCRTASLLSVLFTSGWQHKAQLHCQGHCRGFTAFDPQCAFLLPYLVMSDWNVQKNVKKRESRLVYPCRNLLFYGIFEVFSYSADNNATGWKAVLNECVLLSLVRQPCLGNWTMQWRYLGMGCLAVLNVHAHTCTLTEHKENWG